MLPNHEIYKALSKFQGSIKAAPFDSKNPFYNNAPYASLTSVMDTIRDALAKEGLGVFQKTFSVDGKHFINTILTHSSGDVIESGALELKLDKPGMQPLGSAITYAKRYQLSALLGVVSDSDDDGNATTTDKTQPQAKQPAAKAQPKTQPKTENKPSLPVHGVQEKKQLAALYAAVDKKKIPNELMPRVISVLYGKESTQELGMRELSELTDFVASNDLQAIEIFVKDQK